MNEFILNDMKIAKTNGSTAHEMLPRRYVDRIARERTHPLILSVSYLLICFPSLRTTLYTDVTIVDVLLFAY